MAPNQKAKDRDRQAREGYELVAENIFAREVRNDLTNHSHRRQDHDVDGRMRVKPEQVLKQDGITADRRIEDTDVRQTLERNQQDRDRYHGRSENHDQSCRVMRPDK